ncbi:hypothetical protein [Inquilinus sp. CAU 1745]|uniref:hypothetical protein n=1 Tax=Inquilinus sp. CAU 1745 TaxID=3140369 RepID=UPI00325B0415
MAARIASIVCAALLASLPSPPLRADLGDYPMDARSRELVYLGEYGAERLRFSVDERDRVIRECWQAPQALWNTEEAWSFARALLPDTLGMETPVRLPAESPYERYRYLDDTTIILMTIIPGAYGSIEVRGPGFEGRPCPP